MKYVVYAIVLALSVPLYSQEIRLDSLWIKMGGYPVMAFSPDSKFLLLGQADGIVNIVEVETGTAVDTITLPKNGYADFRFSPDGKTLIVSEKKQITLYSSSTWDSIGVISGLPSPGSLSISPDGRLIAVSEYYGGIAVIDFINRRVMRTITRPSSYKGSNNQDIPFNNGRVNFNSDGTLLYGKNAEEFGSWDLTKTDAPFVRKMTIGNRAVIGFTPDNRYMVQQSNYIWDLNTKAQVQIEGLGSGSYNDIGNSATSTSDSKYIFCTDNVLSIVIDIQKKRLAATPHRYVNNQLVSPNNSYYTFYRNGAIRLYKLSVMISNIVESIESPKISMKPFPGQNYVDFTLNIVKPTSQNHIEIVDMLGRKLTTIYKGTIDSGETSFRINTEPYSSGEYYIVLTLDGKKHTYPFIINK